MEALSSKEKNYAIINYITFIGMIVAYFFNKDLRSDYVTYHIKVMFGLVVMLFISQVSHQYINIILGDIIWLISFVLWIISFVYAFQGKRPVIPYLSENFQKWFTFLD
ncbi:hypothetical protein [Planktosalinus lacus]|uniref:Chloroplast import component protein (Tic20) n=1 Tax=Planktosalinus lacus TaxID=1526573 RepID=A0A8J2VCC1_9FLAO|nr:hypothetical protein [Planktosalinus lacus]GGD97893.1 hypothetical protein GCM10011312_21870 [Planktosalinus lacus]